MCIVSLVSMTVAIYIHVAPGNLPLYGVHNSVHQTCESHKVQQRGRELEGSRLLCPLSGMMERIELYWAKMAFPRCMHSGCGVQCKVET